LLHYCHAIATLLPRNCYTIATHLLHYCHAIATLLPRNCYTVATQLLHYCHALATLLPRNCYTIATQLLHYCHAISKLLSCTNHAGGTSCRNWWRRSWPRRLCSTHTSARSRSAQTGVCRCPCSRPSCRCWYSANSLLFYYFMVVP
jgi:hypothetical protein